MLWKICQLVQYVCGRKLTLLGCCLGKGGILAMRSVSKIILVQVVCQFPSTIKAIIQYSKCPKSVKKTTLLFLRWFLFPTHRCWMFGIHLHKQSGIIVVHCTILHCGSVFLCVLYALALCYWVPFPGFLDLKCMQRFPVVPLLYFFFFYIRHPSFPFHLSWLVAHAGLNIFVRVGVLPLSFLAFDPSACPMTRWQLYFPFSSTRMLCQIYSKVFEQLCWGLSWVVCLEVFEQDEVRVPSAAFPVLVFIVVVVVVVVIIHTNEQPRLHCC